MEIPQLVVVLCLLIATSSSSTVGRETIRSTQLDKLHEINPVFRVRRQSSGTGGLCIPDGGQCNRHHQCCSSVCQSFSSTCLAKSMSQTQIDLASLIIDSTYGGPDFENRFGEGDSSSAGQPTCAKEGEYCTQSMQCCSQRCLGYSYKCVPNHSLSPPPQSSAPLHNPQNVITIDQLISNRFGEPTDNNKSSGSCQANGVSCTDSNKCCSKFCAQATLNTRVCVPRSNEVRPSDPQTPETQPPPSLPPTTSDGCVPIGGKCYVHDECCSDRCHGFLHQCVT
ncbi:hypothetical protein DMENIID0001_134720 [Sergentomyia squamirostris]